jgi:hypothetical protein
MLGQDQQQQQALTAAAAAAAGLHMAMVASAVSCTMSAAAVKA